MLSYEFPEDAAVLVIGGTGGIGQTVCSRFAEAGSNVAFTYGKNTALAAKIAEDVRVRSRTVAQAAVDVTDPESVKRGVGELLERCGRFHSVVYTTAPQIQQQWLSATDSSKFAEVMAVNVQGLFNVIHEMIPLLRKGGSFITITSSAVHRYPRRDSLSAIPKASMEMLTKVLAKEEGRYGIRANCVAPHVIEIPGGARMHREVSEMTIDQMKRDIPLQRFGVPTEVADAVVFLASAYSSYINGQVLIVDGGWEV